MRVRAIIDDMGRDGGSRDTTNRNRHFQHLIDVVSLECPCSIGLWARAMTEERFEISTVQCFF